MQTQLSESLKEFRSAGATGAGGAAALAALCLWGHAVAAVCPLLPLQYLILLFEFILLL